MKQKPIVLTKEQWKRAANRLMGRPADYKSWQDYYREGNYDIVLKMFREFALDEKERAIKYGKLSEPIGLFYAFIELYDKKRV